MDLYITSIRSKTTVRITHAWQVDGQDEGEQLLWRVSGTDNKSIDEQSSRSQVRIYQYLTSALYSMSTHPVFAS